MSVNELRDACRYVDSINDRVHRIPSQRSERQQSYRPPQRVYAIQSELQHHNQSIEQNDELQLDQSEIEAEEQHEIQAIQAMSREYRMQAQGNSSAPMQYSGNSSAPMRYQRSPTAPIDFSKVKCYNCIEFGHFATRCTKPQRVVRCAGCNAEGTWRKNCLNCRQRDLNMENGNPSQNPGNAQQTQQN